MHLRLIEIENFRGIKSLTLKLDVVTAIFGEGSFGKSSLIDALHICLASGAESGDLPVFGPKDFHVPRGLDEPQSGRLSITLTFREGTPYEWSSADFALLEAEGVINEWRDGRRELALQIEARRGDGDVETKCRFLKPDRTPVNCRDAGQLLDEVRRISPVIVLRWYDTGFGANNKDVASDNATASGAEERMASALSGKSQNDNNAGALSQGERFIVSVYRRAIGEPDRLTREELALAVKALVELQESYPRMSSKLAKYQDLIKDIVEIPSPFSPSIKNKSRLFRFGDVRQVVALLAVVGTLLEAKANLAMPESAQPIVAVENLEVNLHPIALATIWDLLAQIPVQKILITNSDDLLSCVPIRALRRVVRTQRGLSVFSVRPETLTTDDLRRIGYHLRLNRADAIMNRCWVFVEGESEGWLLPEVAHILGYDFKSEGVRCVEFAQCGIEPLIKLASDLGIEWHLLADGDQAGQSYVAMARRHLRGANFAARISSMTELDIEHHLCKHGSLSVYKRAAGTHVKVKRGDSIHAIVRAAVKRHSKPALILEVIEQAQVRGLESVSPLLVHVVETAVALARSVEPEYSALPVSRMT